MNKKNGNNAPPAAVGKPFKGWLKVFEEPRVENRQKNMIIMALIVAVIALAVAVAGLTPLKQRVPYFIESDQSTGAVNVSTRVAREFKPGQDNVVYFLKLFLRDVVTIDARLTPELYFPEAYSLTRGNATQQLRQYIVDNKVIDRMTTDSTFKRDPKVLSLPSTISEGVSLVRYSISDSPKRYAMTVHYVFIPPETDEERLRNAVGFFVTDFVINEEN